ncbi:MAG: hypothetical protein Ct9H300mP12_17610 [Acidimicrobiales bacterium]|nr:MAG: hypothetical protein Ct9H300mP12_17610 [Acidimicrobiales bacterium]
MVGISMLNPGHLTLGPRMVEALADAGLDVPVVIGGIVPDEDFPAMANAGVAGVSDRGPPRKRSWPASGRLPTPGAEPRGWKSAHRK